TALALQRRVEGENNRRRALLARAARDEPLRVLNAVTKALPDDAFVQRLEWNGATLHLSGEEVGDVDLTGAIRQTGVFANARNPGKEAVGAKPGLKSFEIIADARPV